MAVLLVAADNSWRLYMKPRITKLTPNEFRFEYEDIEAAPLLHNGDTFTYENEPYRVVLHKKVFTGKVYTSILVIAERI
jgi:hypothetical protein